MEKYMVMRFNSQYADLKSTMVFVKEFDELLEAIDYLWNRVDNISVVPPIGYLVFNSISEQWSAMENVICTQKFINNWKENKFNELPEDSFDRIDRGFDTFKRLLYFNGYCITISQSDGD